MRRRALLLVLCAGGLAAAGGAALGADTSLERSARLATVALARTDVAAVVGRGAASSVRVDVAREVDLRGDHAAGPWVALLLLPAGWWTVRARSDLASRFLSSAAPRTRAPPRPTARVFS